MILCPMLLLGLLQGREGGLPSAWRERGNVFRRFLHEHPSNTDRLRGGSEALHSRDFDPIEQRLADIEAMHKEGHLSDQEASAERERILLSAARSNLDLQQEELSSSEDNDQQALNATIARRANNNLARQLAQRPQDLEACDGSACGGLVRPDGRVGYSAQELALWRRRAARLAAEEAAGLRPYCMGQRRDSSANVKATCRKRMQHGDNRMLAYWIAAAVAHCRADAKGEGETGHTSSHASPGEGGEVEVAERGGAGRGGEADTKMSCMVDKLAQLGTEDLENIVGGEEGSVKGGKEGGNKTAGASGVGGGGGGDLAFQRGASGCGCGPVLKSASFVAKKDLAAGTAVVLTFFFLADGR